MSHLAAMIEVEAAAERPEPSLRRTMMAGVWLIVFGFGSFFGWSLLARLDSAAVAPGVVIVDSHRKTVQHLEGGILKELLVREGDVVEQGEPLLRLDDTQAAATLAQLTNQRWSAVARVARLEAERENRRELTFPRELSEFGDDPRALEVMATQQQYFRARWETYDGQIAVQRKRIGQLNDEIAALNAQAAANAERLVYTEEEARSVKALLEKGYERRPRLLELQRSVAEMRGRRGELAANVARAEQQIAAAELEIINLLNVRRTEVVNELQEAQAQLADLDEKINAAADVVRRRTVTAPQSGKVVDLRFYTIGGVIAPGAPILDIVPIGDELIVEAKVSPIDIDVVRVGLPAQVRLTAYRQRRVPPIEGEVLYVSADKLLDDKTGDSYFLARLKLSPESLDELADVELYPGMPAEVFIVTGERKAIDYFISPILDTTRRAFRED